MEISDLYFPFILNLSLMQRPISLILSLFFLGLISCHQPPEEKLPNIIYILADDMGYGDISALNPEGKIHTPHLNGMVQKGMSFSDAHSGSSVCTPTRYGILTGRYAWRTTRKSGVTWSWSEPLIPPDRTTVASMLKRHGYHTGCIGKWHLGLGWDMDENGVADIRKPIQNGPNVNGFDYFWGITASLDIPPYIYIKNNQSTTQVIDTIEGNDLQGKAFWRKGPIGEDFVMEEVLPKLTEQAVDYVHEQAKTDNPFFLYFPLPAPHTPILPTEKFQGKSGTNAYGDFVQMVDDVVGQVIEAVEQNGLTENTLIIFTTDNGCSPRADFEELAEIGHDPSFSYRGHKADIFEGGHRVPFIAQWPAKIKGGSKSDETICLTDLMATASAIVGDSLKANEGEDSYNVLPVLLGEKLEKPLREATVHHSVAGAYAIRQGNWKLNFCPGSGGWSYPRPAEAKTMDLPPVQLYDLSKDIGEENNLAESNPEKVEELTALMESYIEKGRSTPGISQANDTEETILFYLNRND